MTQHKETEVALHQVLENPGDRFGFFLEWEWEVSEDNSISSVDVEFFQITSTDDDYTPDRDTAVQIGKIHYVWDGCMRINFGMHFCETKDLYNLAKLLAYTHEKARKILDPQDTGDNIDPWPTE